MSRRGRTYDAAHITRPILPGMRQAPPIREQARGLRIAPLTQRILSRIDQRREAERGRVERRFEQYRDIFEEQAIAPMGEAPDRPPLATPCTSVAETTRQWEDLQRFRLFTDLVTDPLDRRWAIVTIRHLLRQNVEQLRLIATHAPVCPEPGPRTLAIGGTTFEIPVVPARSDVAAAIVSEELARAAVGSAASGSYVGAPSATLTDRQARDFAATRMRISLGLEPIPNGVLLFRPQVGRVLDHLAVNPTPTR